jgi:mRNA-degrading endonuclease RelE of RelBE toxin-antitoxin system
LRDEFSILEIGSDALKYAKDLNDHHAAKVYEQLSKLAKFGYEYFQVRRTILGNDILLELNNRGIESSDESKRILDKIKKNKGSSLQMRRFSTLNGKSKQMTYHIKIGGNEVRIYFYFCTETNKVLIGYCGKHL